MLKDITLGQYYPSNSILHRLDPRTKLAATLGFLTGLFVTDSVVGYVFAAVMLAVVIRISGIPLKYITKGLKPILMLLLLSVAFNMFLTPGRELVSIWKLKITEEGLRTAIMMGARLVLLVLGSTMLTLTTTPNQLTDGIEKALGFLSRFNIPVHEVAMMMSIALRFIPILAEEADKIMKAQMARGADFESGGLLRRAKAMIPVLVPLFVSAFRRASDLAMAMEARCYHGGARTRFRPLKYEAADKKTFILTALFIIVLISTRRLPF